MANEAVIIELPRNIHPVRRTCVATTTIEKNTLLKLSDNNLVEASGASSGDPWGGVAAMEKDSTDGSTSISVHLSGVFDFTNAAGPAIAVGVIVSLSGPNLIKLATEAEIVLGAHIGQVEEHASGSEVSRVRLRGY